MTRCFFIFFFLLCARFAFAQDTLSLSSAVGRTIDSAEKVQYGVLTFWPKEEFQSAQFILQRDSTVMIVGTMKDGSVKTVPCTREYVRQTAYVIDRRAGIVGEPKFDWVDFLFDVAIEASKHNTFHSCSSHSPSSPCHKQ